MKLGGNTKIPFLGKVKIGIRLNDGSLNFISDVLYASSICQNFGQLADKGYDLHFNKEGCLISEVKKGVVA